MTFSPIIFCLRLKTYKLQKYIVDKENQVSETFGGIQALPTPNMLVSRD